jgi:hypothetical protein
VHCFMLLQWDNFMQQMEPIISQVPYMTAIGNHERDWPNSGDRYTEVYDSGRHACLTCCSELHLGPKGFGLLLCDAAVVMKCMSPAYNQT